MKALKIAFIVIICILIGSFALGGIYVYNIYSSAKDMDISFEDNLDKFVFLKFYDVENNPTTIDGVDFCKSSEIKPHTFNAFVAKEDKRFYNHNGIDIRGILRAGVINLKNKHVAQGGSTITQQLAKNLVLSSEKKLSRKLLEVFLAKEIENKYSKDEILTMYLNVIYFGENTFGITNASMLYFGKKPSELTVSESAMLAGIIPSPEHYSPVKSVEIAKEKRDIVLTLMGEQQFISQNQADVFKTEKLSINITKNKNVNYDYFNHALKEASDILQISEGELCKKDYKIFTYINGKKQNELFEIGDKHKDSDCVLISLDNANCGVSGVFESLHDGIYQKRSPASLIKPLLVYAPALEENVIFENSIILDKKTNFDGYVPNNYLDLYYGNVTAKTALAKSLNVPSVKILDALTPFKARLYASRLEMPLSKQDNGLSIALGGLFEGVSPLQLSSGYMCLANGGEFATPSFIREIQDSSGNIIFSREIEKKRVFGSDTAYILTDMLNECATCGTAKELGKISKNIACKTGTNGNSQGNFDAYACGYTTCDTFFCWIGNRYYKIMPPSVKGSTLPIENASAFFGKRGDISPFSQPANVEVLNYDRDEYIKNGKLLQATEDTPKSFVSQTLISKRYFPILKSLKYSYPKIISPKIIQSGEFLEISIDTQSFASYEIYDCINEKILAEFVGNGDFSSTVLPASGEFVQFQISARNTQSGKKGEVYKFEKLYLIKDFLPKSKDENLLKGSDMPTTDEDILNFFT